jgi:hypothetical protein
MLGRSGGEHGGRRAAIAEHPQHDGDRARSGYSPVCPSIR